MPGTNLTRAEAAARSAAIAVIDYTVQLDLTGADQPGATAFTSVSTVHFTCREPGADASTFLDLVADDVTRVTLNGRDLDPAACFRDSRIELKGLDADNTVRVEARCRYSRSGEGLHRFEDPADSRVYLYSQFEVPDARRVFAAFDQPDLKAQFTFIVAAPRTWAVVSNYPEAAHEDTTAGRPGAGSDLPAARGGTWHRFDQTPRIACHVTAIVAGPYHRWDGTLTSRDGRTIPLGVYARESLAQYVDAEAIFDITRRGFGYYEEAFDYPYPYAKYDQLFVPEFNAGAMENVGAVTIVEKYVFRSAVSEALVARRAITVLHELAHMWFGDLVTMRWWDDLWLAESFAEFASHLSAERATRWTDAWTTFSSVEKTWGYEQDQLPSTHPIMADIRDLEDIEVNFDGITYAKGASVLRQLVAWVGEDAFLKGVAAYFTKHAFGVATLRDLITELETASGRDLADWSRLWLRSAGLGTITPAVKAGKNGRITGLTLEQTAPADHPELRPHRIGVAGYGFTESMHDAAGSPRRSGGPSQAVAPMPTGKEAVGFAARRTAHDATTTNRSASTPVGLVRRLWRTELDIDGAATEVPDAKGRERPLILLPNDGDLAYAKVRLDPVSLENTERYLGEVADPLARAVLWTALWNLTRDGELAATSFVRVALAHLGRETDPSTLQTVLGELRAALTSYVAPSTGPAIAKAAKPHGSKKTAPATVDRRAALRAEAAWRLLDLADSATPGSDAQLQFVTSFALLTTDPAQLTVAQALLDGRRRLPGRTTDVELSWQLLEALVRGGRAGEDQIAAAAQRDPGAAGQVWAERLRAEIPTPEAKAAAWRAATTEGALANHLQRAAIAGFTAVPEGRRDLLVPYVEPYFDGLERVWAWGSHETAANVVDGLFPGKLVGLPGGADILALTDGWLKGLGDRSPALRRLVEEARAGAARALAAQAEDAREAAAAR